MYKKSSQSNSTKDAEAFEEALKFEEALYLLHLKVHLRFDFKKLKHCKKCEEKDAFDFAPDGSLDNAMKGTPLNLKCGFLRILYI